jgi:hypothetical protein
MTKQALRHLWAGLFAIAAGLAPIVDASAASARIKDIVVIEGVRENQLVGYGLVVGLNGTGDSLNNTPFTRQSLQAMLERLGVNTHGEIHADGQCRRGHGNRQSASVLPPRAAAWTSASLPSVTPTACRAARCSSRHCWAPMARSTPSRRAR